MAAPSRTEELARTLAAAHHGVVARRQLHEAGCSERSIRRLFDHPRWEVLTDQVIHLVGTPTTAQMQLVAAVLDAGPDAFVSHLSAANRFGLTGCALRPFTIVRLSSTTRTTALATVHRVRRLPPRWLTESDAIPIVRPELLAMQLFAVCRFERAERLVERLWADRLLSGASLASLLDEYGARGRNGIGGLRRYVEERGPGYTPTASGVESRALQLFRDAGLDFRRQVDSGGAMWSGRVDFLHATLPLVVEIQSERHHSALTDRRADAERRAALVAAGFDVLELTDTLIWTDPAEVLRRVTAALEATRRRRSVP